LTRWLRVLSRSGVDACFLEREKPSVSSRLIRVAESGFQRFRQQGELPLAPKSGAHELARHLQSAGTVGQACHNDRTVHRLRVARALYGSGEGGAPPDNPKASAYLLAVYAAWFPAQTVFLCVIDPGIGGARPAIIIEADSRWYVGPGNGLFELVQRRVRETRCWDIEWKPEHLSASFHGRDLFAPVAAMLARGEQPPGRPCEDGADRRPDWPDDLCEIVYINHFGNAMTGVRAAELPPNARLAVAGRVLERARTFSDLPVCAAFWYENSNGLAEIAANQRRADRELGLSIGIPIEIIR
jgi:S-adenosyl-L-methionine hydrolase (adenosine-forming)